MVLDGDRLESAGSAGTPDNTDFHSLVEIREKMSMLKVIPSRDNSRCPFCGARGYLVLPWSPPVYFDPNMEKVKCTKCGEESYIGPKPRGFLKK